MKNSNLQNFSLKISVIIPVYNVAPYLKRCMDSVIKQTLKEIEIICIDDCSTDASLKIIEEYAKRDERIKIISLKQNSGVSVARNKGLDIACGQYYSFIDPDDEISLNFYERLYSVAETEKADIVKCRREKINTDGKIEYGYLNNQIKKRGKYCFTHEWVTAIYKSSVIKENEIRFNENLIAGEDLVFLSQLVNKCKKLCLVDDAEYIYHRRERSLFGNQLPIENIKSYLNAKKLLIDILNKTDLYQKDRDLYFCIFLSRISDIYNTVLFRNSYYETKKLCSQYLIELFFDNKNPKLFSKYFLAKELLPFIERKDVEGLTALLSSYSHPGQIKIKKTFTYMILRILCIVKRKLSSVS